MGKKKIAIILTVMAAAAIMGGIAINAYSSDGEQASSTDTTEFFSGRMMMAPCGGWQDRGQHGQKGSGFVEVSEEFEAKVVNIAKNDSDVQTLISEGYNVTSVRPIIKTVVEADGSVTMKATSAVLMLEKKATGRASVWVDVDQAKVT